MYLFKPLLWSSSSAQRMYNALERLESIAVRGLNYKMLMMQNS